MLSRNNWLPLVVVLGLVAIFGIYVESRLSALAVLDTKLALTEKRLGSLEQSSSQQEVELRVENQKLANRLELAQGRNGLLESRINELEKNLGRFSTRLGNEGEDGSPGSVADRLKLLEGSLGNVSQSVATLRQDNAGRAFKLSDSLTAPCREARIIGQHCFNTHQNGVRPSPEVHAFAARSLTCDPFRLAIFLRNFSVNRHRRFHGHEWSAVRYPVIKSRIQIRRFPFQNIF